MPEYSEQDLKYASELREDVHKEALEIVRRVRPDAKEIIDRHPVEDYFQKSWEYPGKWYVVVAIPEGYKSRKAFTEKLAKDTLTNMKPDGDQFYALIADYPGVVVEYYLVKDEEYSGYESHRKALKKAFDRFGEEWKSDPDRAEGKKISAEELFSKESADGKLNYRKAFLFPPHGSGCTRKDFDKVNDALFPGGTGGLEVYEWTTDWSDYFDDGREWWGTLCLTVYDKTMRRFAVITASATD